ncbi:MAG TPA: DUF2652 domain-containing protein [Cytophagaceae bacterium]
MSIELINSIEEEQPALFYIPDLTGFTEFLHKTKIQYSKKLIHELLEVIVDSNILNFKIAEILGDAIVFYQTGAPPDIHHIEAQAIKTFKDFQEVLERFEKTDMQLKGAAKLTLKIIVHYGCISTTNIKNITKLVGLDLIIAHRILKNNIKNKEYLLMTEQYLNTQNKTSISKCFKWSSIQSGHVTYPHIGAVRYKYISLSPLRKRYNIRKPISRSSLNKLSQKQ